MGEDAAARECDSGLTDEGETHVEFLALFEARF
jgi:hypothetical protein